MLVLLPPSEGKAASGRGAPLKPESLSLPGLAGARAAVLDELVELCAGDEDKAREVLGLSEGLRGEIAKNAELRTAGTRPAGEIYTGVLYDALGPGLAGPGRQAAGGAVAAGLLGAVGRGAGRRPDPVVPLLDGREAAGPRRAGRALAGADGVGRCRRRPGTGSSWTCGRRRTRRRGSRRARWRGGRRPCGCCTQPTPEGRGQPLQQGDEGPDRTEPADGGRAPKGPAELVEALRDLGYVVEAEAPARAGRPWALDVLVTEIH